MQRNGVLEKFYRTFRDHQGNDPLGAKAVATVFANNASVLLLDEPFGALDYVTKRHLHDVLLDLWGEADPGKRLTVIFVTHDVDESLILADRILVLRSGLVVDDLAITAPRPRTTDVLLEPQMVRNKHVLLAHLGLESMESKRETIATAG